MSTRAPSPDAKLTPAQLHQLSQRSDRKGLCQLSGHLGLLAASGSLVGWCYDAPLAAFAIALLLHGAVLVFLFAPLHESIHYTAFHSRRLNRLVATLCGFLLLLPPGYFRAYHLSHHRHTQDPARDPELSRPKPHTWQQYMAYISGLPLWYERITTTLRHAAGQLDQREDFLSASARPIVVREARMMLSGYLLLAVLSGATATASLLWWYWLLPLLLAQPLLRGYLLAEHGGCRQVADSLQNSRTTRSNLLLRWLAWNMPYHAEHHAYAAVPFHALPHLHRLIGRQVMFQSPGYWHFHRHFVANLRL